MMTKEEYEKEIVRMWDNLRDEHKGERTCCGVACDNRCPLYVKNELGNRICWSSEDCFEVIKAVEKWSKEHPPKKYKVSQLEYDILKYLSDNTTHRYIIRDNYRNIYLFDKKPKKSGGIWYGNGAHSMAVFNKLFQFVQWEDKEPTSIQDVLKNCEVEDDTDKR